MDDMDVREPAQADRIRNGRLRIAFVIDCWTGNCGGVVSARRMVSALRARHEVVVAAACDCPPEAADFSGMARLRGFYPPFAARLLRENEFIHAVPERRILIPLFQWADVVHVQFPNWLGIRSRILARRLGKPLVSGFHVQPENLLRNIGVRAEWPARLLYRFFLRRLFNCSDAVVCPSPFALETLRSKGLAVHAEVISNGIGPGFGPGPDERPPHHRGKIVVAVVGRLSREKRVDTAIEGVRRSRHAGRIQMVITGRGPEEQSLRRMAAALPLPAEMGVLTDDALRRLLRSADLMIHASEAELEGMAVLEGLASGTPALLADSPVSAARQFAVSGDFLFRPGDPSDLARKLDLIVESSSLLAEARTICLERAKDYRLETSVARLETLYRRVASKMQ